MSRWDACHLAASWCLRSQSKDAPGLASPVSTWKLFLVISLIHHQSHQQTLSFTIIVSFMLSLAEGNEGRTKPISSEKGYQKEPKKLRAHDKKATSHPREQEFWAYDDREKKGCSVSPDSTQVSFVNSQNLSKSLELINYC